MDRIRKPDEIMAMEEGKELEHLIPKYVMGIEPSITTPSYSKHIKSAWKVVEAMLDMGYVMTLSYRLYDGMLKGCWYCHFALPSKSAPPGYQWADNQPTAALAICKAAILAKSY